MKISLLIIISTLILLGCNATDKQIVKNQIREAEAAFNKMAAEEGVKEAFLAFATDSAVLSRGGKIIKGKAAIRSYFKEQTIRNVKLQWEPAFVDVSETGDMGYTYGPFEFWGISHDGDTLSSAGIFHTIWKKQPDGNWKFVYD